MDSLGRRLMSGGAQGIGAGGCPLKGRAATPQASVGGAASHGSGKTKVLVDRVLSLLLGGSAPARVLCLTFTKAAAAEMANRLSGELARWVIAEEPVLRARLEALLGAPVEDRLQIGRAHV